MVGTINCKAFKDVA